MWLCHVYKNCQIITNTNLEIIRVLTKSSCVLTYFPTVSSKMADYFSEMGWQELREGETPNHLLHLARLFRDYRMFDELNALNGDKLAPPASIASVEALESVEITSTGIQCPICLKEHSTGETVKKMPCKHTFHPNCILPWLSKTNSCPLCRHELPTDDEDYEEWSKEKKRAKEREADIENLHNSMFS